MTSEHIPSVEEIIAQNPPCPDDDDPQRYVDAIWGLVQEPSHRADIASANLAEVAPLARGAWELARKNRKN